MSGKKIQCASCTKTMRSDNLKRSCKSNNPKNVWLLEKQLTEEKENNIPEFIEGDLYNKKPKTRDNEKQRTIPHFNASTYTRAWVTKTIERNFTLKNASKGTKDIYIKSLEEKTVEKRKRTYYNFIIRV